MKKNSNRWILYLETAAVSVLAVVQSQKAILPQMAGIVIYALAAVSLTAACGI
ncbi:MAG TPA: hypothetical protein IAA57_12800 [Candidatus Pullilachnospira intestinigallinarum]|nr:hypothetical protein [Candidatus Pullilachnospira intestinigallinarum]